MGLWNLYDGSMEELFDMPDTFFLAWAVRLLLHFREPIKKLSVGKIHDLKRTVTTGQSVAKCA